MAKCKRKETVKKIGSSSVSVSEASRSLARKTYLRISFSRREKTFPVQVLSRAAQYRIRERRNICDRIIGIIERYSARNISFVE